jgi:hypothetical protein
MHGTARCFGYPSDSTRTARERAREATCGHRLRWPGPVRPGQASFSSESCRNDPSTCGPTLRCVAPRPVAQPPPLRCFSPLWLNSGRRRATPTSHWSWVTSRAARRGAGSPARIATVVLAGVQWGGLGLAPPDADRRQHRVSRGPGDSRSRPSHVRG